jgi:hypothetical protein
MNNKIISIIQDLYDFEYQRMSTSGQEQFEELINEINKQIKK